MRRPRLPIAVALLIATPAHAAPPAPLVTMATQSGGQALDRDEFGGNPFASAFIQTLDQRELALPAALAELKAATVDLSGRFQTPDVPAAADSGWRMAAPAGAETPVALVIVLSEYRLTTGLKSLPGAAFDAVRVSRALRRAGYATEMVVAADLAEFRAGLDAFRSRSARSDTALIYTTGHGVETGGKVWLIGPDYPRAKGKAALPTHAIAIAEVATAAVAKSRNLVFYAGCRDDPLGAR